MARAKQLAKMGFIALTFDKRGVGESGGNPNFHNYFTFDTLAHDVVAALQYLKTREDVLPDKMGLFATSQGGWVAPLVANEFPKLSFMAIVSGSVSTVGEDNFFERNARLKKESFSDKDIEEVSHIHAVDIEVSRSGKGFEKFASMWEQSKTKPWFRRVYLGDSPMTAEHPYRLWYRKVVDFNPVDYLEKTEIPVLWIYGDRKLDRFCPIELSVTRLKELESKGKNYTIVEYPNANHSIVQGKKDMIFSNEHVKKWFAARSN